MTTAAAFVDAPVRDVRPMLLEWRARAELLLAGQPRTCWWRRVCRGGGVVMTLLCVVQTLCLLATYAHHRQQQQWYIDVIFWLVNVYVYVRSGCEIYHSLAASWLERRRRRHQWVSYVEDLIDEIDTLTDCALWGWRTVTATFQRRLAAALEYCEHESELLAKLQNKDV